MKIQVNESNGTINIEINPAAERKPEYFGFGQTVKEFGLSEDGKRVIVITPDDAMVIDEKSFGEDLRTLDDEQLFGVLDCDFFNPSELEIRAMIDGIKRLRERHEP